MGEGCWGSLSSEHPLSRVPRAVESSVLNPSSQQLPRG